MVGVPGSFLWPPAPGNLLRVGGSIENKCQEGGFFGVHQGRASDTALGREWVREDKIFQAKQGKKSKTKGLRKRRSTKEKQQAKW